MIKEVYRYIDSAVYLNVNEMFDEALRATRIGMSEAEKKQFAERYIRTMQMRISETGDVEIMFKR